jgi:hypothetical protein
MIAMKKLLLFFLIISLIPQILLAVDKSPETIIIEVKKGDTLRKIAGKYLGNPDAWHEIMRMNSLKSADQLRVGDKLRLVANSNVLARKTIIEAQESISNAVDAGASIYAQTPLEEAKKLLLEAQTVLKDGRFVTARMHAFGAKQKADFAYAMCSSMNVKEVRATLSDLEGGVETKKEEEVVWHSAEMNMNLYNGHKVRTFASARSDVTFINGDLMRIGENSLAVIKEMKLDTRRRSVKSSVVLLQGDIAAQLQRIKSGDSFEMATETGVELDVDSKDFFVDVEEESKVTRVAVYDDAGKIEVSSAGESVSVGANQGTKILPNRPPEELRELLVPPRLLSPEDRARFTHNQIKLVWNPVKGAAFYKLEVASDHEFKYLVTSENDLKQTEFSIFLEEGKYYWRVKCIDSDYFPGAYSPFFSFEISIDREPPPLLIKTPRQNEVLLSDTVKVTGTTEPKVNLLINGTKINVNSNGEFAYEFQLDKNQINFIVTDMSGNITRATRNVVLSTNKPTIVLDETIEEITNQINLPISGTAEHSDEVYINDKKIHLNKKDRFNSTIRLQKGKNEISIVARDNYGRQDGKRFLIILDTKAPDINLRQSIQRSMTTEEEIRFYGTVDESSEFTINGELIPLVNDDVFNVTFELEEGENQFSFQAVDRAGNRTVQERTITKDSQPPELLSHSITPNPVTETYRVELTVSVKDDGVGERKILKYAIEGENNFYKEGILERNNAGVYSGEVIIPQNVKGYLRFDYIIVEDYLGNSKKYEL